MNKNNLGSTHTGKTIDWKGHAETGVMIDRFSHQQQWLLAKGAARIRTCCSQQAPFNQRTDFNDAVTSRDHIYIAAPHPSHDALLIERPQSIDLEESKSLIFGSSQGLNACVCCFLKTFSAT